MQKIGELGAFGRTKPTQRRVITGKISVSRNGRGKGEKPQKGVIIALGTGLLDDNGKTVPFNVEVSQTVMFKKYAPEEIEIDGEEYLLMLEKDILAVIVK